MEDQKLQKITDELKAMPLDDRIRAVAKDVKTRKNRYRRVDPHDLAELVGIADSWRPSNDWRFIAAAKVGGVSVEEYTVYYDPGEPASVFDLIEGKISRRRVDELRLLAQPKDRRRKLKFTFLKPRERRLLDVTIAKRELKGCLEGGLGVIARRNVHAGKVRLCFEGYIEDDGACITLRTPYDERDGRFKDLTDCVMAEW